MASRKPLLIALALGLLASSVVSAQPSAVSWPNVVLKYATDGTPLLQPRVPLASTAAGGGAATLNATQRLAIGSTSANLNLTRNVPVGNLAKVARVAARALGPLALAGLVYEGVQWVNEEWMTEGDTYSYPDGVSANRSWIRDHNGTGCKQYTEKCSFDAAVAALVAYLESQGIWQQITVDGDPFYAAGNCSSPTNVCSYAVPLRYWWNNQWITYSGYQVHGYGTDGPGAAVEAPATDSELEISFQQGLIASPSLAGQVLDAALASSAARAELVADAMAVTGPATVDGGTATSTRVETAGTTTIQTQTTYNLSYQGDTVNLTQTQVETVTDPANNVTTTTTTTEAPTGDPPPPDEPLDLCAENPDASGCAPFGTPEPPTPLPQEDRTVSVAPEMSAAGACPAPQAFSIAGQSFQLTYDGACEFAQGIRPVVLAVAWMGAFVFLFSIGRAQTS